MEKEVGNAGSSLDYKLLFSYPLGLSQLQVWDQKNGSSFNGKKFRYGGYSQKSGDGSKQESHVCLHPGLTDYRTFVGTNLNPSWEKFLVASEDDLTRCQLTSSPLGNGAIVETSYKKIVALQRSNNVGEFPGHFIFPGGHPEPQEVGIETHRFSNDSKDSELVNKKVSQQMFESIICEVVEEIGVPTTSPPMLYRCKKIIALKLEEELILLRGFSSAGLINFLHVILRCMGAIQSYPI